MTLTLTVWFNSGSVYEFDVSGYDRDELDQLLEDAASGAGATLVTPDGPVALPSRNVLWARVSGMTGEQWLTDRVGGEDLDVD